MRCGTEATFDFERVTLRFNV